MNTRLQVEHPITEMVTGTDLVRAQLRVACGHAIPWKQEDLRQRGWAIEFRIYAEDPARNFAPSIGRIASHTMPTGPGVRVDTGIYEGFDVPIHYDPLLAKLVVWGEDRQQAIARGRRALSEFTIHGPGHNVPFHLWALEQPRFIDGTYTTNFIDECFDPEELQGELSGSDRQALLTAAAIFASERRMDAGLVAADGNSWRNNWRLDALRRMTRNR
jgi:acetyl/propionyl-CoA carboxylase alpha subunit